MPLAYRVETVFFLLKTGKIYMLFVLIRVNSSILLFVTMYKALSVFCGSHENYHNCDSSVFLHLYVPPAIIISKLCKTLEISSLSSLNVISMKTLIP